MMAGESQQLREDEGLVRYIAHVEGAWVGTYSEGGMNKKYSGSMLGGSGYLLLGLNNSLHAPVSAWLAPLGASILKSDYIQLWSQL